MATNLCSFNMCLMNTIKNNEEPRCINNMSYQAWDASLDFKNELYIEAQDLLSSVAPRRQFQGDPKMFKQW